MARVFDYSSDYIEYDKWDAGSIAGVSLHGWVKLRAATAIADWRVIDKGLNGSAMTLMLSSNYGANSPNITPRFRAKIDGTMYTHVGTAQTGLSYGEWHQMGGCWSSTGGNLRTYFDGSAAGNTAQSGTDVDSNQQDLRIGNNKSGGKSPNANLADIAIWKVELTAAQWAALGSGVPAWRIAPQSLIFYVPFWGINATPGQNYQGNYTFAPTTNSGTLERANHAPLISLPNFFVMPTTYFEVAAAAGADEADAEVASAAAVGLDPKAQLSARLEIASAAAVGNDPTIQQVQRVTLEIASAAATGIDPTAQQQQQKALEIASAAASGLDPQAQLSAQLDIASGAATGLDPTGKQVGYATTEIAEAAAVGLEPQSQLSAVLDIGSAAGVGIEPRAQFSVTLEIATCAATGIEPTGANDTGADTADTEIASAAAVGLEPSVQFSATVDIGTAVASGIEPKAQLSVTLDIASAAAIGLEPTTKEQRKASIEIASAAATGLDPQAQLSAKLEIGEAAAVGIEPTGVPGVDKADLEIASCAAVGLAVSIPTAAAATEDYHLMPPRKPEYIDLGPITVVRDVPQVKDYGYGEQFMSRRRK